MKRKKVTEVLEDYLYIEWTPLPELIKQFQEYQVRYEKTHARVWVESLPDMYGDHKKLVLSGEREENDQEYKKRVALAAKQSEASERSERQLLKKLKQKYGG